MSAQVMLPAACGKPSFGSRHVGSLTPIALLQQPPLVTSQGQGEE